MGVSEQVMAAVVQHVYQLMALEAALEGCNDQSTWTGQPPPTDLQVHS